MLNTRQRKPGSTRWRRRAISLIAAAGLAVATTGCSGAGEPAATPSDSATPSPQAYSQCMRTNGVPAFPDPDPQGRVLIKTGDGLRPDSPEFQAAETACQHLAPTGARSGGGNGESQALRFAECMRANGVPQFPDPENGRIRIGRDMNPESPEFQQAQQLCQGELSAAGD